MGVSRSTSVPLWGKETTLGSPEFWNTNDPLILGVEDVLIPKDFIPIPQMNGLSGQSETDQCAFEINGRLYQATVIAGHHGGLPIARTVVIGDTTLGGYDAIDIRAVHCGSGDGLVKIADVRAFRRNFQRGFGPEKVVITHSSKGVQGVYAPYKPSQMNPLKSTLTTGCNGVIQMTNKDISPEAISLYYEIIPWFREALSHSANDQSALDLFYRQFPMT